VLTNAGAATSSAVKTPMLIAACLDIRLRADRGVAVRSALKLGAETRIIRAEDRRRCFSPLSFSRNFLVLRRPHTLFGRTHFIGESIGARVNAFRVPYDNAIMGFARRRTLPMRIPTSTYGFLPHLPSTGSIGGRNHCVLSSVISKKLLFPDLPVYLATCSLQAVKTLSTRGALRAEMCDQKYPRSEGC